MCLNSPKMQATFSIDERRDGERIQLSEPALSQAPHELTSSRGEGPLQVTAEGQPGVSVFDELSSSIRRLCFDSLRVLLSAKESEYTYRYTTAASILSIHRSGDQIRWSGALVPEGVVFPLREYVAALFSCGRRYLSLLARALGDDHPAVRHQRAAADVAEACLQEEGLPTDVAALVLPPSPDAEPKDRPRWVRHDYIAASPEDARAFYRAVLGDGVEGTVFLRGTAELWPPQWVGCLLVRSLEEAIEDLNEAGSFVVLEEDERQIWMDVNGVLFGITAGPAAGPPVARHVLRFLNVIGPLSHYKEWPGWEAVSSEKEGEWALLDRDGALQAHAKLAAPGQSPQWGVCFAVSDVDRATAAALAAGAARVEEDTTEGEVWLIDPWGALFGLSEARAEG